MIPSAIDFYGHSRLTGIITRQDVLSGGIIRINPALITLIDGRVAASSVGDLQAQVMAQAQDLLGQGVFTFHVDINCDDYGGFGANRPDSTRPVFAPQWVAELADFARHHSAFVNVHLLTDNVARHLEAYRGSGIGALCFQLDAVPSEYLPRLIERIHALDAAASPVIETVGTSARPAETAAAIYEKLKPVLADVDMLTIQATTTAARSNQAGVMLDVGRVKMYLTPLRADFAGTIQIQGGITTQTIPQAVQLGAEFLVAGTQIFRGDQSPGAVITAMLQQAAEGLSG